MIAATYLLAMMCSNEAIKYVRCVGWRSTRGVQSEAAAHGAAPALQLPHTSTRQVLQDDPR